jgi:hypothetical protein
MTMIEVADCISPSRRTGKRAWAFGLLLSLSLSSCAKSENVPDDLTLVSVRMVDSFPQDRRFPPVPLNGYSAATLARLEIQFSSKMDLVEFSKKSESNVDSNINFCEKKKSRVVQAGGGYIVFDGFYVEPRLASNPTYLSTNPQSRMVGPIIYKAYAWVRHEEVESGPSASPAFDLSKEPQDLCLQLVGGNWQGRTFRSNVLHISKEKVASALRTAEEE